MGKRNESCSPSQVSYHEIMDLWFLTKNESQNLQTFGPYNLDPPFFVQIFDNICELTIWRYSWTHVNQPFGFISWIHQIHKSWSTVFFGKDTKKNLNTELKQSKSVTFVMWSGWVGQKISFFECFCFLKFEVSQKKTWCKMYLKKEILFWFNFGCSVFQKVNSILNTISFVETTRDSFSPSQVSYLSDEVLSSLLFFWKLFIT